MTKPCRLCGEDSLEPLYEFPDRPIAHSLLSAPDEDEPVYPMAFHLCPACGLIQVVEPVDPEKLYTSFNYNFSSWKPEPHLEAELDMVFKGRSFESAIEIGCNDGSFLAKLRDRGVARCTGIEPNPVSGGLAREKGFDVFKSMVSPEICEQAIAKNGKFDLVVSRQVIEHVPDLATYFACIRTLLADDGVLFLDMPDYEPSLKTGDCSVAWEEHVSYFSKPVLDFALRHNGFKLIDSGWYDFSSGCLAVVAVRDTGADKADNGDINERISGIVAMAREYPQRADTYNQQLRERLSKARKQGAEVALYGVGVRGSCAVNGLDIGDLIDFAVDDQPERQGKYMAGCRLEIRPSSVLADSDRPLVCLLAVNNENDEKVSAKVHGLGDRPAVCVSLCSPVDINVESAKIDSFLDT